MFIPVGTEEHTPRQRFPVVTTAIVALNVLVFLVEVFVLYNGGEEALTVFITAFGVVPAAVTTGQSLLIPFFLTPFTSMFVHGSLTHIGFNMLFLLAFGDNVEDRLGRWRYLLFYLLSGLVAAFAQIAVDPASPIPSVGASGAIAGVLAAYLVLFPKGRVRVFFFLGPLSHTTRISAVLFIGFWFVTQFFSGIGSLGVPTAETGGVAYWAHIGGFDAGLVLVLVFRLFLSRRERVQAASQTHLLNEHTWR
ncbi:MAG TPA: rhomboid family intramembrane serine protease [Anaerolineae bacterium]|nr:rhomboid family intramembrane serine protease [Anaerolineae bacterium]